MLGRNALADKNVDLLPSITPSVQFLHKNIGFDYMVDYPTSHAFQDFRALP